MIVRLILLTVLAGAAGARAQEPTATSQPLDVSKLTTIRITGEASSIVLTTEGTEPFRATLEGRRSGWFARWFSSWSYSDCRASGRMRLEGTTLLVEAGSASWLDPSDCAIELRANVPAGVAVEIAQAASQVDLQGEFSTVSLDNKAADFVLTGHATALDLRGDALRSSLTFSRTRQDETISIAGRALDTSLRFATGTLISYRVDATAAMVDSALPDTQGVKPSIVIRGHQARIVIR